MKTTYNHRIPKSMRLLVEVSQPLIWQLATAGALVCVAPDAYEVRWHRTMDCRLVSSLNGNVTVWVEGRLTDAFSGPLAQRLGIEALFARTFECDLDYAREYVAALLAGKPHTKPLF